MPSVSGSDKAIWDRLRVINFPISFDGDQQDKFLSQKLLGELPGIFNWALEGNKKWNEFGLEPPETVKSATNDYRDENDQLGQWISTCCTTEFPKAKTPMKEMHESYSGWCLNSGTEPLSIVAFGKEFSRLGFKSKKSRYGTDRIGIALLRDFPNLKDGNNLIDF